MIFLWPISSHSKISQISWEDVTNEPYYFIKILNKIFFSKSSFVILKKRIPDSQFGSMVKSEAINRTDGPVNQTN